jgi:hypothetical protein
MAKVFAFLLAITEINLFMVNRDFIWKSGKNCPTSVPPQVAKALICNEHLSSQPARPSKRKRGSNARHELIKLRRRRVFFLPENGFVTQKICTKD